MAQTNINIRMEVLEQLCAEKPLPQRYCDHAVLKFRFGY